MKEEYFLLRFVKKKLATIKVSALFSSWERIWKDFFFFKVWFGFKWRIKCIFCNYQQNQAFSTVSLFLVLFGLASLNENETVICPKTLKKLLDILWKERVHVCKFFYYWLDITDVLKTLTSESVLRFIMVSASLNWIRGFAPLVLSFFGLWQRYHLHLIQGVKFSYLMDIRKFELLAWT